MPSSVPARRSPASPRVPTETWWYFAQSTEQLLRSVWVEISDAPTWFPDAISARSPRATLIPESVLHRFKRLLSQSWSPETAYPGAVDQLNWSAGDPCGQCGVSSVWLAEVLRQQYSICSTFCIGSLVFYYRRTMNFLDHHCWLEINGESSEELILDLTCDQAPGFCRPIVFDSKSDLNQEYIHYVSQKRVDVSQLPTNPVWPRYQRLLVNLHKLPSGGFGEETLQLANAV